MSFKIRRVVSGLLPQVTSDKLTSGLDASEQDGSPGRKRSRIKRLSVDIEDFLAEKGNSSFLLDGNKREREAPSRHTKHGSNGSIVDHAGSPKKDFRANDFPQNVIGDDNVFRPQTTDSRMSLGIQPQMDIEFDSSDHNLPQKLNRPSQLAAPKLPFTEPAPYKGVSEKKASEADVTHEQVKPGAYTPRRLSPLRKEVLDSRSSTTGIISSTPGDLVEEIRQSNALRSRSTQEILDQINSSMDQIKANASTTSSSEDSSEEAETPAQDIRLQSLSDFVSEDVLKHARLESLKSSPRPVDAAALGSLGSPKKRSLNTEVSERNAKKFKPSTPAYGSWLFEKWDKLKRLAELPVPNAVIVKNAIVMKELGCTSEQELQQRLDFVLRNKMP